MRRGNTDAWEATRQQQSSASNTQGRRKKVISGNPNRRMRRQGKLAQEPPEAVRAYASSSDSTAALPRQGLAAEQQQRLAAASLAASRGGQGAASVSGMRQQTAGEAAPVVAKQWPSKESADASVYMLRRPDFGDDRSSEAAPRQSKRPSDPDAFQTESAGWQFIRPNATQNASSYTGGLGGEFTTAGEQGDSAAILQQSSGQLPGRQSGTDLRQSDDNNPNAAKVRPCRCHMQYLSIFFAIRSASVHQLHIDLWQRLDQQLRLHLGRGLIAPVHAFRRLKATSMSLTCQLIC